MGTYKGFDGNQYKDTEEEVDEMMKQLPRPRCKVCDDHWKRGALTVCKDCIEYFCDYHMKEHVC